MKAKTHINTFFVSKIMEQLNYRSHQQDLMLTGHELIKVIPMKENFMIYLCFLQFFKLSTIIGWVHQRVYIELYRNYQGKSIIVGT